MTIEVFDHAVIGQNPKLIVRENHALEKIIFLFARVIRILGLQSFAGAAGALGAVVSVGDVEQWNCRKGFGNLCIQFVRQAPNCMRNTVCRDEIKQRFGECDGSSNV